MATVTLNPLFESVSGRIGNAVFYRRGNTQCVRGYVVPGNPDTVLQRKTRAAFGSAVKSWQKMTSEEKYAYTRKARNLGMSGYNLFISAYIKGRMAVQRRYNAVCRKGTCLKNNALQNQSSRIRSVSLSFLLPDTVKMPVYIQEHG